MASGDSPQPDTPGSEGTKNRMNGKSGEPLARAASVTELELQFATNPDSTAYVDLCLAYIDQGRFMEAMVVCKKGIKAHPDSVEARVLLARVYSAQKKYKRALQELDELIASKPDSAEAFCARGKMKLESGDESSGIEDLKKAIDLKPGFEDATKALADRGIEYPEKPKAPPPPPPPPPQAEAPPMPASPYMMPVIPVPSGGSAPPRMASYVPVMMPPPAPEAEGEAPDGEAARNAPPRSMSMPPGAYPPGFVAYMPVRQRLEGEEELEELAKEHAETKAQRGKPKTSLFFAIALVVLGLGITIYRFSEKRRIEAIDRLTGEANNAFNNDTYNNYKNAAAQYEEILDRYDSTHPATLGRLALAYAILWGEHGELTLKEKLDRMLERAEKRAKEVPQTVAARGLAILYDGKDRQANAIKAREVVSPVVERVKQLEAAPSHADLTLGMIDLELGNYEEATQALAQVKQAMPASVRAKVWHARAAFRAGRLGTAEAAFTEALRSNPAHPGARAGLALAKITRGDLNGAAEQIVKFDELPPKDISDRDRALAEFARSEVFRAAGDDSNAAGAYANAVRFDPSNADFPFLRGRSLLETGQHKESLQYLKKAADMEKTRWLFLTTLAEAEMWNEDNKNAEAHIEDALRRAPSNPEPALAKARLYRRTKNADTESYLNKLLKDFPSAEGEIQAELGRHYRAQGKLEEAKAALEKAIDKMSGYPPLKQGDIVLSYAKLMKERGEMEIAVKSFRQAAELGNMEASFRLIEILSRTGEKDDRAEAKRHCARYLAGGAALQYADEARSACEPLK
jgi:cellulose synthase operon protein C